MAMRIDVVTIFPEYLAPLRLSLIGKAIDDGIIGLAVHDLRSFTTDRHHSVDDAPYGGGPGMVMRADVWGRALHAVTQAARACRLAGPGGDDGADGNARSDDDAGARDAAMGDDAIAGGRTVLVIPTPSGEPFTQQTALELAGERHLIFACGRYEGIDGRVAQHAARTVTVRELSIGDYVLAGGEAAALVIIEAVGRLLPGVLGNVDSAADESFSEGLLEGPVYTRPAEHRQVAVPGVLLSGDHAAILRWRRDESLRRTAAHRPDLLARLRAEDCDAADLAVLEELGVTPPAGLAERVAAERAARAAKRRRRGRG